ncbi:hypothetical protein BJ973_003504 [Actinoplanes tereljensis]|uniref:Uncharacterized protein n=1 Tax=Paractinoplanes tereljensis TaxID=571912 RepID=A0A919NZM7_9ACTN|nr:hypothetical protein [Actinoplanes tereljensis]GIF26232.1 hypothetical protein Ate02nite_89620 [Actinoplanes tereljensis]
MAASDHEWRLAEKPSKRDVARSRDLLLALDADHRLNSIDEFAGNPDYLRVDNTDLSPADTAALVMAHFGL